MREGPQEAIVAATKDLVQLDAHKFFQAGSSTAD